MSAYRPDIFIKELDNRIFNFAPDGPDAGNWEERSSDDPMSRRVKARIGELCYQLAAVPHVEAYIPQVDAFLEGYGLESAPVALVDLEGYDKIGDIMGYPRKPKETAKKSVAMTDAEKAKEEEEKDKPTTIAGYFPMFGFTYIVCDPSASGDITNEAALQLAHEIFHKNTMPGNILMYPHPRMELGITYDLMTNGFVSTIGGTVLGSAPEEGGASLAAHDFTVGHLGLTNGLLNRTEPLRPKKDEEDLYRLPGSYLFPGPPDNPLAWSPSAYPAYALQLLRKFDPAIHTAMIAARKSTEGMHEFVGRIRELDPGLPNIMWKAPYEPQPFRDVARYVIDKLLDGDQDEALSIVARQDARATSRRPLAA